LGAFIELLLVALGIAKLMAFLVDLGNMMTGDAKRKTAKSPLQSSVASRNLF
jgi:hypothetical protein